jgi:hypothetical protein
MISYLRQAFADAGIVELRVHTGERCISGLFDSVSALNAAVESHATSNIYTTLNRPRAMPVTNAMGARALRDQDIESIVRLPFDFDPARPVGQPSTETELKLAITKRNAVVAMLTALGWPQPATARSGNGAHALYRCRLPNTNETRDMLISLYRGLREEFNDELVSFDATVRNASRIWRLYGTTNRKGQPTPDRPHRKAEVSVPSRWEGVAPRQIDMLANRYARLGRVRQPRMPARSAGPATGSSDTADKARATARGSRSSTPVTSEADTFTDPEVGGRSRAAESRSCPRRWW